MTIEPEVTKYHDEWVSTEGKNAKRAEFMERLRSEGWEEFTRDTAKQIIAIRSQALDADRPGKVGHHG